MILDREVLLAGVPGRLAKTVVDLAVLRKFGHVQPQDSNRLGQTRLPRSFCRRAVFWKPGS